MFLLFFLLLAAELQQSLQDEEPVLITINEDIRKNITDMHNEFRRKVNPPASNMMKMMWSDELAKGAEKLALKCTGTHSTMSDLILGGIPIGESIGTATDPVTWDFVLNEWHNQGKNFKYGKKEDQLMPASYTQMIWDRSRMIGCALSSCPKEDMKFFFVCHYFPAGNIDKLMTTPYKTGETCGECSKTCEDKLCTTDCEYFDNSVDCKESKEMFGCDNKYVLENCRATCNCKPMN